jgi:phage tail protein X
MEYLTKQDDILDDVVHRYYGDLDNRAVEIVLEANRGLADHGPKLPAGLVIVFPDRVPTQETRKLQTLWT